VDPSSSNTFAARLKSGEADERERAWRALYDEHFERVYRLVCRFGVEPAEVEDIAQRAFVIAFRRIHEVEEVHEPAAWLRGIVVRVVAQHRRWRRVREAKRWILRDLPAAAPPPVIAPDAGAAAAQEMEDVRQVLARLSSKLRDVLVLCDIEDCAPREAAALLGIPVNTVRSRRRLAREKFSAIWRETFGDER
jgi:RNA polymerase sigma-70 factor (ECF subfamily)